MTRAWLIVGLTFLGLVGQASAQSCPCGSGSRMNHSQISTALANKTVCASVSGEVQQEFHTGTGLASPGALVAYKRGPGHAMDPSETVGTWEIVGTGATTTVRYSYTGGNTYSYAVCNAGVTFTFCGVLNITGITTRPGPTPVAC